MSKVDQKKFTIGQRVVVTGIGRPFEPGLGRTAATVCRDKHLGVVHDEYVKVQFDDGDKKWIHKSWLEHAKKAIQGEEMQNRYYRGELFAVRGSEREYMLVGTYPGRACLVSMDDGNRWGDSVEVTWKFGNLDGCYHSRPEENPYITGEDAKKVFGADDWVKVPLGWWQNLPEKEWDLSTDWVCSQSHDLGWEVGFDLAEEVAELRRKCREGEEIRVELLHELNTLTGEIECLKEQLARYTHEESHKDALAEIDRKADEDIDRIIRDWKQRARRHKIMQRKLKRMEDFSKAPNPLPIEKQRENWSKTNSQWKSVLIWTLLVPAATVATYAAYLNLF